MIGAMRRATGAILLLLSGACAVSEGNSTTDNVDYSEPIVLFVSPDSAELEAMRARLGDDDFYVAADDAMWYRATAYEFLDSLGVPHAGSSRGEATFLVDGAPKLVSWRDVDRAWFTVVYDGRSEPIIGWDVSICEDVARLLQRVGR